ncbi:hypothetical protein PT287_07640 [Lactobacillus sp. ESL0679]|uniref:hypothetical protein n=1 Tax=Lactobacillus sp. ESL0679 TaxID=2983209 RepID=UPI0023F67E86|nr:hypothetical protein [Lactobacillus sp. ESL0679]MDF7683372.1 hypothetical protein [Lactobacillus sp. ESL0679]
MEDENRKKEQSSNDYSEVLKQKDKQIRSLEYEVRDLNQRLDFSQTLIDVQFEAVSKLINTFDKFNEQRKNLKR